MTPYADLLYFGIALWAVVPAVVLGLSGRLTWQWGLISTLGMLVAQYVYAPGPSLSEAWPPIAVSLGFVVMEWVVAQALLRWRSRTAPWRSWLAVLLAVMPLAAFKFVPFVEVRSIVGFVGISYVSFRAIDALLAVHDRLIDSLPFGRYLTYVLFFPTLSAGPIDRWRRFTRDIEHAPSRGDYVVLLDEAAHLLFTGILYKFVLAAAVQTWWMRPVAEEHGLVAVISYMYAYSAFLFFDFAGYSAFAMAFSRVLGVRTPENFRRPFAARNISDFWSRWHISLSSWFRDQIYMRFMVAAMKRKWLGGRRVASAAALLLTFGLMGVWHGTAWRYVVYGLYHALLLIAYEWWRQRRGPVAQRAESGWRRLGATVLTVQAVCVGFLIFSGRLG